MACHLYLDCLLLKRHESKDGAKKVPVEATSHILKICVWSLSPTGKESMEMTNKVDDSDTYARFP
jgi:hypothetical protein